MVFRGGKTQKIGPAPALQRLMIRPIPTMPLRGWTGKPKASLASVSLTHLRLVGDR
jgi:hypothetical protein